MLVAVCAVNLPLRGVIKPYQGCSGELFVGLALGSLFVGSGVEGGVVRLLCKSRIASRF